ncbi:MAG: hypothetical protein IJI36_13890 [Kiritimatiellae bacterium]|nr:hypothetical protein [Kiritimatiellia bacterium]
MKKTMTIMWIAAAVLTLAAGIVEETKSKPVLAGTAQIAPLGDVTQKVTSLGTLIGNPIVPALLLSSGQQQLVEAYGRLRADAPVTWFAYVQTPAWEVAATNLDQVAVGDMFEHVLVYPITDGPANLLLKHPGATKEVDGTIHLLAGEKNPSDMYVKYTADNRYCAFASSPVIAAQALADFAAFSVRQKPGNGAPLLRIEIVERGVTALATLYAAMMDEQKKLLAQAGTNDISGLAALQGPNQKKVQALLDSVASCTITLDIDKSGLTLDTSMAPRPGRKTPFASDFVLPKGALDRVPAAAPLFYCSGDRFSAQCTDEAAFRADMAAIGEFLVQAAEQVDDPKYKPFLKDVASAFSQMIKAFPYPDATDWTGLWLAFDEQCHPWFEGVRQAVKTAETHACSERFNESLMAAVEKQWPGKGLLVKDAGNMTFDVAALVDLCGAEAGVKPGDKEAKALANAKEKIGKVLGAAKLVSETRCEGDMTWTRVSALGLKPAVATQPTGEVRMAAALPETTANRPVAVFNLELYALARNAVLPIMAKVSKKKDAKQYKAIIAAMPPPEANSAIAGASWTDANGSLRSLLRVTAGEIKNLGAAFNAFTAASLAGADND